MSGKLYLAKPEKFKTLYLDPGEDAGWALGNGPKLLAAGTEKMWILADYIWMALASGGADGPLGCGKKAIEYSRHGIGEAQLQPPIGRIVCEDWRIYRHKAKAMINDPCRTARLIGAVTMMSRIYDIPFFLQPAAIKPEALALGAEEYYYHPLHENRHQNDAIQHFVYFRTFGPDGSPQTANRMEGFERPQDSPGYEPCGASRAVARSSGSKTRYDKLICRKPQGHRGAHNYV